jgi:hypothetical protein
MLPSQLEMSTLDHIKLGFIGIAFFAVTHGTIDRFFGDIFGIEKDALGYFVRLGIKSV